LLLLLLRLLLEKGGKAGEGGRVAVPAGDGQA